MASASLELDTILGSVKSDWRAMLDITPLPVARATDAMQDLLIPLDRVILRDMKAPDTVDVVHLIAELTGVAPARLHDRALLGGLLIAAAGAAGLHAAFPPTLHTHAIRGVDGLLLLDGGHAAVHAHAPQRTLLLDLMVPEPADLTRALDVFARRLSPTSISAERVQRIRSSR